MMHYSRFKPAYRMQTATVGFQTHIQQVCWLVKKDTVLLGQHTQGNDPAHKRDFESFSRLVNPKIWSFILEVRRRRSPR